MKYIIPICIILSACSQYEYVDADMDWSSFDNSAHDIREKQDADIQASFCKQSQPTEGPAVVYIMINGKCIGQLK